MNNSKSVLLNQMLESRWETFKEKNDEIPCTAYKQSFS